MQLSPQDPSPVLAGFGLGIALAGAPGPVQAVLVTEAVRGGIGRGFRALAGANLTFALLLIGLAFGLSIATPTGTSLRILRVVGGLFLLWLALEGFRAEIPVDGGRRERRALSPVARGALAVLLNPGAWLFLGAVASPLFASASQLSGAGGAFLAVTVLAGVGL
jgi:threonine/homoserine/homoserine lactone efflux protein